MINKGPSLKATPSLVSYCFSVLANRLNPAKYPLVKPDMPNAMCSAFVTYKIMTGGQDKLRGCIGNFGEAPVEQMLGKLAIDSAINDHRFSPIREDELSNLVCSVSLLIDFEQAKDAFDWEVGTHGIRISFGDYGGTYLPEVMPEQGWNKEEALRSLIQKAGYFGHVDSNFFKKVKLVKYQSSKCKLTWGEHIQMNK